jgi:hypothetical protein
MKITQTDTKNNLIEKDTYPDHFSISKLWIVSFWLLLLGFLARALLSYFF